ncbi:hypothetical protein NIIDNTM18_01500 [Mycolicibacterium litorale]|uniref:Major facilitator superfamily (MFS) profile domain-containing protein n=1 Tax=Mycolicibacterium litorale TaxID=758802 RepID=A0A6S6NYK2_9MYCO|nr:MFS transporter [Mycolicibacterium litorale]BCI50872.1 hypothetical protein NIIDNTM18_01500 [Mycolicibacterium litorale]
MDVDDDQATEDAVFRKVSLRVVPLLGLAFFMSFLDRINIGILATSMETDLALSAEAFGFAVGIFYIGYLILQVPSNVAMYKFGGRIWITRILVTWGIACAAIAFVETPTQLYIARFALGAAEAGLVPAILLLIAQWYPRAKRGQGYALFQLWEPFALAVGAVVTTALLAAFTGVGPLAGWRWVFLIEGLATVVVGGFLGPYIYGVLTTMTGGPETGLYVMGAVLTIAALLAAFIDRLERQSADSTVVDGLRG